MTGTSGGGADSAWPGAFGGFSGLLLDLYRLAPRARSDEFQERSLDAARAVLGFDSAVWGSGVFTPQGPLVHTVYAYRQPPAMMESWSRIKNEDHVNLAAARRPGETIRATAEGPEGGPRLSPEAVAHCHRFGIEHVLATVVVNPSLGLLEGISFFRADPQRPFSEPERVFKQNFVTHLVEARTQNLLSAVAVDRRKTAAMTDGMAVCDKLGMLHAAGAEFAGLMQAEWPGWHGPNVPDAVSKKFDSRFVGEHIVVSAEANQDLWLVRARQRSGIDELSARELEVARKFAQGLSYQDVAEAMHISPSTVRNHLTKIYDKLGVSDKAALANLLKSSS